VWRLCWKQRVVLLVCLPLQSRHTGVVHVEHAGKFEQAVVHQWLGLGHIPQGRCSEPAHIFGLPGHSEPAKIFRRAAIVAEANVVELAIGKERPMVTVEAAGLATEEIKSVNLIVTEQAVLATHKPIKPATTADNGPLKAGDGLYNSVKRHLRVSKCRSELLAIAGHCGHRLDQLLPSDVHFCWIE